MNNLNTIIICFILLLNACKPTVERSSAAEAIPVKVCTVKDTLVLYPVSTSGMLKAGSEIKLSFKTGGIVDNILVHEGGQVKKGDILARLNLSEINAGVIMAASALDKAKRDLERVSNLYNDSVAPLEMYQNAKTALDVATSNYNIASFNKEYSVIIAPGDGKILKILYEENEMIAPGYPLFLFASTGKNWLISAGISDRDVVHLSPGDSANISFDAFPGQPFNATVTEISKMADPYTGSYQVELTLLQNPDKLVSGLIGKAEIFPSFSKTLPFLPMDALIESNEMTGYVYTLNGNVPVKAKVKIDKLMSTGVAVSMGVKKGDIVITDGMHYILKGSKVEVVE